MIWGGGGHMWRSKSCICEWNSLFNFCLEHIEYKYKGRVQFFLSTVCFCRVFAYLIHEKIGIEKWTSGNSLTSFPPPPCQIHFSCPFYRAIKHKVWVGNSRATKSWQTQNIPMLFFFAILQRNLTIIYDVKEWEPIATCAHMRTLRWIQSERFVRLWTSTHHVT